MPNNRVLRWLAICGIASQVLFFLAWFATEFFEFDSYSIARDFTSDLGSLTAAHPGPYNAGVSLSGLLAVAFAVALYLVFRRTLLGRIGAVLIAVFGAGQFLDGLFREDCVARAASCKALGEAPGFSWHHQAHDIESLVTALSILIAPFVFAAVFKRLPEWRSLWLYSLATGFAGVALVVPFAAVAFQDTQPAAGLLLRLLVTVLTAWLGVVAWWMLKPAEATVESRLALPA